MVGLDCGEILCGLHEGMPMLSAGQEVVDAAGRMIWQPREDVGDVPKALGFAHVSARPRHPTQDAGIVAAFKQIFPPH